MELNNTINVALFENRHDWPKVVTDYVYHDKGSTYDPRDFKTFEGLALLKFLKWKSAGITIVNLYLSGLVSATIAALNAAYSVGIYVKLFHYSNLTGSWIPQILDFLPAPPGIIIKTESESLAEKEEEAVKDNISENERVTIVSYVELFNKLYHTYDPDKFFWDDVYKYITREYGKYNEELILLMKPYFENKNKNEMELNYGQRITKYIEEHRNGKYFSPLRKFTNKRRDRKKFYRTHSI